MFTPHQAPSYRIKKIILQLVFAAPQHVFQSQVIVNMKSSIKAIRQHYENSGH